MIRLLVVTTVMLGCGGKASYRVATVRGVAVDGSSCTPDRGAPPDPTLGVVRPIRIGVGSIVHARDGTTESFAAHDAWAKHAFVPARDSEVVLVDHPTDADYTISGTVSGDLYYTRKKHRDAATPAIAMATGYGFGFTGLVMGGTFTALDNPAGEEILTAGIVLTAVGLANHVYLMFRPSNQYEWSQQARLTLRRNGVRIGEVVVSDSERLVRRSAVRGFRTRAFERIWREARDEIGRCIAADLRQDTRTIARQP